jgi:guanyl-specific ribonuclease Sa
MRIACSEQTAWDKRDEASVKALYADTGALSANASANNLPGVVQACRKLASDAIAAAALPAAAVRATLFIFIGSPFPGAASGRLTVMAGASTCGPLSAERTRCRGQVRD